ncbi:MAG: hypothetical protein PVH96_15805 [Gemmatimonadota bacterium]
MGSIHDPHCPHHPGSASHAWWLGTSMHGGGEAGHWHPTEGTAQAESGDAHDVPDSGEVPEDCSCDGGLCVVPGFAAPLSGAVADVSVEDAPTAVPSPSIPLLLDGSADRYLHPPGRGPPAVV